MCDEPKDFVVTLQQIALRVRNAQSEAESGQALATYKKALIENCPPELVDVVASIGNSAADAVRADEQHEERRHQRTMTTFDLQHRTRSAIIGIIGLVGLIALSFVFPDPSDFQLTNLRLARALCGAAIFGGLAGQIKVQSKVKGFAIQATSAAGAAIVFYFL
jgi:hypothetical protein